jgi:hypothetical protein
MRLLDGHRCACLDVALKYFNAAHELVHRLRCTLYVFAMPSAISILLIAYVIKKSGKSVRCIFTTEKKK